jgi:flagellar hook-associated protein 1 FlgK
MGSLALLMNSSLSALKADQAALDATSNNVANQNTVGYTREVVNFQATDIVTLNGSIGDGVSVGSGAVSQRDRVLEQRVQQQTQAQGESAALDSAWQQIEGIFNLSASSSSAGATALGSAMDSFFSSLTALTSDPSNTATRQGVLSAAQTLAAQFNSAANQVTQISAGLDQQVGSMVNQINGLTATIAKLNNEIETVSPNGDAGTLDDQRQQAIAQLSQYVGLNQITTERNGITLTTTSGQVLVSGANSYALGTTQVGGVTHVMSSSGQDMTAGISGGQLGGILNARDVQLPGVMSQLDTLANVIASDVNSTNASGFDEYGNAGQAVFTIPGTVAGSAAGIAVTKTDPMMIAAAGTGEGNLGNTNAIALADLSTGPIIGETTASSYFATFLAQVGSAAASASSDSTQQQTMLTQLTTQRDQLSGVSLDDEAANLTKYQRSYQAAAQVFSILNTLMASAINMGVETAVS